MKLNEKAPPSKEAEEWIKSVKSSFKNKYGDDWERVLYSTAWKKFGNKKESVTEDDDPCWDGYEQYGMKDKNGKEVPNCVPKNESRDDIMENNDLTKAKNIALNLWKDKNMSYNDAVDKAIKMLARRAINVDKNKVLKALHEALYEEYGINEHDDYDQYVNPWREQGYEINVTEYTKDDGSMAWKFHVKSDEIDTVIVEPETGVYEVGDETFDSFDEAMGHLIQSERNPDEHIMEDINQITKNAGIVKQPKQNLNENIQDLPTMGIVGSAFKDILSNFNSLMEEELEEDKIELPLENPDEPWSIRNNPKLLTLVPYEYDEDGNPETYTGKTKDDIEMLRAIHGAGWVEKNMLKSANSGARDKGYKFVIDKDVNEDVSYYDIEDLESHSYKPVAKSDKNFKRTNNHGDNALKSSKGSNYE